MNCQQLITMCICLTTFQIVTGQLSVSQRLALSRRYPNSMLSHGVLRRPPEGYHYETMKHILNTYPRNSYKIKYGLENIVGNNNRGLSSGPSGSFKRPKNRSGKKKSNDDDDGGGGGGGGGGDGGDGTSDGSEPDPDNLPPNTENIEEK
ncbi:uncharacterized protein LOC112601838 [Melanaphis sacchari]|uniref:uncharacterized protein LOC112601838 n=1 Tax=Melanaphis sacchari TaxID=742174 RepID=UPI000DC1502F|nr:uncharacterized protein LOC112601838 [Melanaphis sacchari]